MFKKKDTFRNYPIVIIWMPEHYAEHTNAVKYWQGAYIKKGELYFLENRIFLLSTGFSAPWNLK
jgi:hypothetical protein